MKEKEQTVTPDFMRILCADLSLRSPGFAVQSYDKGKISVDVLCHVDNRSSKASHGELLDIIHTRMCALAAGIDVFVRERAFSRFARETQALNKVVGIADLVAWQKSRSIFHEITPASVKKLLTGNGRANKEAVAAAQERYLGFHIYRSADESDAAAVGVAWLIQEKLLIENR